MRSAMLGIPMVAGLLVAGTACTDTFGYGNGVLYSATRGVVLDDGGTDANAGMAGGNTCFVDPKSGWLGTERDYPGPADEVDDIGRHLGSDVILVTTDRGLHLGPANPDLYEDVGDVMLPGIVEARVGAEDIGVLVQTDDGCMAGWAYENEGTLVDGTACELGGLAMNPDVGDLYVSTVEGIVLVPPGDATTVVDAEADLAVYDTFTGFLYTAAKGETWVRAIDGAGAVAWTTDLGSPVVALDDLGWQEGAVALVNFGGTDQVWILDAWTGEATLGDETPAGSTDISVSRNGRDYALVGADQVAFREFARHIRE